MSRLFSELKVVLFTVSVFIYSGITAAESRWAYLLPNYLTETEDSILTKKLSSFDVLSFTGSYLDSRGNIHSSVSSEKIRKRLQKLFPKKNFLLYPLLTFRSAKEAEQFLNRKELFRKTSENILKYTQEKGYHGIHLDIENIPNHYSDSISEFVKNAAGEMRKKNLHISMAVFPEIQFRFTGLHSLNSLKDSLDEIIIMAYDLHDRSTQAGCVTDPEWAEKNIQSALEKFAPEKIRLGIPAYGYTWAEKKSVISAGQGKILMQGKDWKRDPSGCIEIRHSRKGKKAVTVFSDMELREKLSALASKYRLHGTALWRLGLEDE